MNRLPPPVTAAEEGTVAPAACPACGSGNIQTTSKTVDPSSYWRCRQCGEVWNAQRREAARGFYR
jgi:transposase-like protein